MNLEHEYNKIIQSKQAKIISEDRAKYELLKLQSTAKKLKLDWQSPIETFSTTTQAHINEDYKELVGLYKSGILNKKRFERDCIKLAALCEETGLKYPGEHIQRANVNIIAESMDDEYGDLEDDDEYEEDGSDEDALNATMQLPNGQSLEMWTVNSNTDYKLAGGDFLEPEVLVNLIYQNQEFFAEEIDIAAKNALSKVVKEDGRLMSSEEYMESLSRFSSQYIRYKMNEYDKMKYIYLSMQSGKYTIDGISYIYQYLDFSGISKWNWV